MECFEGISTHPVFWGVFVVSAIAAVAMVWTLKFQNFPGKHHYGLTYVAMIWAMIMVGLEASSQTYACQMRWATVAWLGNGLVPVAWCFFIFSYVDNAPWIKSRAVSTVLLAMPIAIFAAVITNPWHNLVYTEASAIPLGGKRIAYVHGPAFYAIIATLYSFVAATLWCLAKAFFRAKRAAWPMLALLVVVTSTPLTTNMAYVGLGFTVGGLDPTTFMFTLGILAFTWLLVTNKTMDMATIGQSVLFNTISEPVILFDRNKKIVQMNSAAKRIETLRSGGQLLEGVFENDAQSNNRDEAGHLLIEERAYEPRIQVIASPLEPLGATLGWSVTLVDITDRLSIHSALERAIDKADAANRAKDDFISVVSHELRTPLTSLRGGIDLALSGKLGDLSPPVRSSLEIAHRNGVRLSRLVDNILLAQKLEIDALSLERKPIDLVDLLFESFEENNMFAAARGVKLSNEASNEPAIVIGDAFAVRQIIDNLVSNAIKFSEVGGVVEGKINQEDECVRLSITDAGCGIAAGMEGSVFGRFEQVKNGGQTTTQGSGLGLHISEKLAKQLSGRLFYESEVGVGTTFHLEFSRAEQGARTRVHVAE